MKRKRIAEINNWALEPANYPSLEPDTSEIAALADLALRATEPEYVRLQDDTGSWAEQQFPESTPESVMKHAGEEFSELKDAVENRNEGVIELALADVGEEAADVVLLLMHLCHKLGINLYEECLTKLAINKGRKWETKPNSQGYYKHEAHCSACDGRGWFSVDMEGTAFYPCKKCKTYVQSPDGIHVRKVAQEDQP